MNKRKTHLRYLALAIVILITLLAIFYLESMKARPGDSGEVPDKMNDENQPDESGEGSAENVTTDTGTKNDFLPKTKYEPDNEKIKNSGYPLGPDLKGISGYINSEKFTLEQLRGKVVLIDFWTYSCINCIRTQPYLNAWYNTYADDGLVIVGIHTPEFGFEKKYDNVLQAVSKARNKIPRSSGQRLRYLARL